MGLKLKILYRISQSTQETFPVQYKRKIYISKKKNLHRNSRQGNKEKRGEKVVFGKFIFEDFQDNFCRSRGVLGRDAGRYGDVGTGYQHFLADYQYQLSFLFRPGVSKISLILPKNEVQNLA